MRRREKKVHLTIAARAKCSRPRILSLTLGPSCSLIERPGATGAFRCPEMNSLFYSSQSTRQKQSAILSSFPLPILFASSSLALLTLSLVLEVLYCSCFSFSSSSSSSFSSSSSSLGAEGRGKFRCTSL